jgi:hypothetical protein
MYTEHNKPAYFCSATTTKTLKPESLKLCMQDLLINSLQR